MATIGTAAKAQRERIKITKGTCQNGSKTSTQNKTRKTRKAYRGQGR